MVGGDGGRDAADPGAEDSSLKTPFDLAKHVFELLFLEADVDRSGRIDHAEFGELLRKLGKDVSPEVTRHYITM